MFNLDACAQGYHSPLNDAAVDGDNLSGDIGRLRRGEKPDQVGNFIGGTRAFHGYHARDILGAERRFAYGGVDNSGRNRVDGDAPAGDFLR